MSNGHIWRTCVYYSVCARCGLRGIAVPPELYEPTASGGRSWRVDYYREPGERFTTRLERCRGGRQ